MTLRSIGAARAFASAFAAAALALASAALPASAPKFVFHVIVDDLGWGDVSFHPTSSPEVVTPRMHALATQEGTVLERFYVHPFCTPSRSSFMSGRLPMHVQDALPNPEDSFCGVPFNMTGLGVKMKSAGYETAFVGKWDLGMATQRHTPRGRGFDQSLIYYEHKNDYWDQTLLQSSCQKYNPIVDLWSDDNAGNEGPARTLNGTDYEEYLFRDRVLSIIAAHDASQPLFLVYTPHIAHCPLQVPEDWLAKFNAPDDEAECQQQTTYIFPGSTTKDYRCRNQYRAMVALLDEVLGNITDALKAKGMWEQTMMVLSSDNGGPMGVAESGSTNYPLRGAKYSPFEGGTRVAAFASGGFLPPAARGTVNGGIVHIADFYGTYSALAGVDPTDAIAAAAGLPAVDSLNVWPLISGANMTSPRIEIPIEANALISGSWKLLTGHVGEAAWGGPNYPNASSPASPVDPGPSLNCSQGCLFDVVADPTEHNDVAAQHPAIVAALTARLVELRKGFFTNQDDFSATTVCPANMGNVTPCGCWAAINVYGGYFGPWAWAPYNASTTSSAMIAGRE
jgi:arylsulfatase B